MKRITFLSLALIIGPGLLAPAVFAQDDNQDKKDAKEAAGSPAAGGVKKQSDKQSQKADSVPGAAKGSNVSGGKIQKETDTAVATRQVKSHSKVSGNNTAVAQGSTNSGTRKTALNGQSGPQTNQGKSRQSQSVAITVQGNRSNQYNGQWFAGNTHGDWDRNGDHEWNNHDYRWYDGGWLIIDAGDYETGSIVAQVKESLTQRGYYNGHISDTLGPHTRAAISNYQNDNDLVVNGRIDDPLLVSLRLE